MDNVTHPLPGVLQPFDTSERPPSISPTDIAQFLRLNQCQRYLRIRLHHRATSPESDFWKEVGIEYQRIPPLLSKAGNEFELAICAEIEITGFVRPRGEFKSNRQNDHEWIGEALADLSPGQTAVLFQPRLVSHLEHWRVAGDVDILVFSRREDGRIDAVVLDIKSSRDVRIEHRLQVAFYRRMLIQWMQTQELPVGTVDTGIVFRPEETAERKPSAASMALQEFLAIKSATLDLVDDPDAYDDELKALLYGPDSVAKRIMAQPFDEVPFHLDMVCDGCVYNELCLRRCAETDSLSLIPHISVGQKRALTQAGIRTTSDLSTLKRLSDPEDGRSDLLPSVGKEALVHRLATEPDLAGRLDNLVSRARQYRAHVGDNIPRPAQQIPNSGESSLPVSDANLHPNLVRIFLDAQHDYLNNRVAMLSALVEGLKEGTATESRTRTIVRIPLHPINGENAAEDERAFVEAFVAEVIASVVSVAVPTPDGKAEAPIHVIFWDRFAWGVMLEALARHSEDVLAATPLFDLLSSSPAMTSPLATFLSDEVRQHLNLPLLCQTLQTVAPRVRHDWDRQEPLREIFRGRFFDAQKKDETGELGDQAGFYTGRARFNNQIPLEYFYAAWEELPAAPEASEAVKALEGDTGMQDDADADPYSEFRNVKYEQLMSLGDARLKAMRRVTDHRDLPKNRRALKASFTLPDMTTFVPAEPSLLYALSEFLTIERHAELSAWKSGRAWRPEDRMPAGLSVIVTYHEEDQDVETRKAVREAPKLEAARQEGREKNKLKTDGEKNDKLPPASDLKGRIIRLRVDMTGVDGDFGQIAAMSEIKAGSSAILSRRWETDDRPDQDKTPYQPTAKQLLHQTMRINIEDVVIRRDDQNQATGAFIDMQLDPFANGYDGMFMFGTKTVIPVPGERFVIDVSPDNRHGMNQRGVLQALLENPAHPFLERLVDPSAGQVSWSSAAADGQARFLEALEVLRKHDLLHGFEQSKRRFIGETADLPVLLVQGPPGTGKSHTTAFALLARFQASQAAGQPFRVAIACKTHAATDVLAAKFVEIRDALEALYSKHPDLLRGLIDPAIFEIPVFRYNPSGNIPYGTLLLQAKSRRPKDALKGPSGFNVLLGREMALVAATPSGIRSLMTDQFGTAEMVGQELFDCVVIDEASQMSLPEALMGTLGLKPGGQVIVVGDHRQMPPIVKHNWETDRNRTFKQYEVYASLFDTLRRKLPPDKVIRFQESFRLHTDMADFLGKEIYAQDGIKLFSNNHGTLAPVDVADDFVAAALDPNHPMIVVLHDERASQSLNEYEAKLSVPLFEALHAIPLDAKEGLGAVVPHRRQRNRLQEVSPQLLERDHHGDIVRSAVDTVERFQGGEREVIVIGATESDPLYLLTRSDFMLDPRRFNVALSRAKKKLILVASRSVFEILPADEETFENARIWKNLLRRTCTVLLWEGERDGHVVQVWGNKRPD